MWDPPRPGLEPVSPALAGRFSTTAPPGKPPFYPSDQISFVLCFRDLLSIEVSAGLRIWRTLCLVKISQTQNDKYCIISLIYGIKKNPTHRSREQNDGWQRLRSGENGKMLVRWTFYNKLSVIRWISSGDLMYSMVTIVNDTILHNWNLLRVGLKCSHYTHTHTHTHTNSKYVRLWMC